MEKRDLVVREEDGYGVGRVRRLCEFYFCSRYDYKTRGKDQFAP